MKYVVVGAGPSGLALACLLADAGHAVCVFERGARAGGSWKSSFDGDYFVENSPRILAGSAGGFFDYLGMARSDFRGVYGNAVEFNLHVLAFLVRALTPGDWARFAGAAAAGAGVRGDQTFAAWLAESGVSAAGARALTTLSILINDTPAKTNARELFNTVTAPQLEGGRQFRDPNAWWSRAVARVRSRPGCAVVLGARVTGVFGAPDGSRAGGVEVEVGGDVGGAGRVRAEPADRVVLCTQAPGLVAVLAGTPFARNWPAATREWAEATAYHAFGFQLHFAEPPAGEPGRWCWSCAGPWTVIVLRVSDWLAEPSRDPAVRAVWSCCVVDTRSPSPAAGGLCADEIADADAVLGECLRQLRESAGVPIEPRAVTLSPGLRHDGARWVSAESGFTAGARERLAVRGRADNLFAAGCFSESDRPVIAHFGSAVAAAERFAALYEPGAPRFREPVGLSLLVFAALCLAIVAVNARG